MDLCFLFHDKEIEAARVKGEKLLELEKSLHGDVNKDIVNMITFFAQPLNDINNVSDQRKHGC